MPNELTAIAVREDEAYVVWIEDSNGTRVVGDFAETTSPRRAVEDRGFTVLTRFTRDADGTWSAPVTR